MPLSVLELLEDEALTPAEVARRLGKKSASIRSYLHRLAREGVVERLADGRYRRLRQTESDDELSTLFGDAETKTAQVFQGKGNEEATEEGNVYDPETAFSEGFADVFGGPPDASLARKETRRFLAQRGLYGAKKVNAKLAGELYLAGQKAAEVELGKRLEEEKAVPNVRERIKAFCDWAKNNVGEEARPETDPVLQEVLAPVHSKLDALAAEKFVQVMEPTPDPAEAALGALCKVTLGQAAAAIRQNNELILEAFNPKAKEPNPVVSFLDGVIKAQLAGMILKEMAGMLPQVPAEERYYSPEEQARINARVEEILRS